MSTLRTVKIVDNDISIVSGQTEVLTDAAALGQILKNKILLWMGEWFLDETQGVDYLSLFDNEPFPDRKLGLIMNEIFSADNRVQEINSIQTAFDRTTGDLTGSFVIQSIYGTVTVTI